ncbi:major facilitator superfamily domain-containing protein [Scleroderma yunnanense]
MSLDRIITDPIISTENTTFNSPSTPRHSANDILDHPTTSDRVLPTERDGLVTNAKKPFYRARPLWLVPFALITSVTRAMTLASRVEVLTELSCNNLHDSYNHTTIVLDITSPRTLSEGLHSSSALAQDSTHLYFPPLLPVSFLKESQGDGVSEGDDPRVIPGKKCVSDPAVQARAAGLQTIMTTTMGVLSALTTGWWGHFGERYGRTRTLAVSTFGLVVTDLIFILVSTPHSPLAVHSHSLLILAPVIEGFLGGWSALTSAQTAYIADCTSPGSRATVFARFSGVLFVGLSLGPILGAWLIRNPVSFLKVDGHPLQSVNSVFWVAITFSFINFLLVLLVLPESLSASSRAANRKGKNRAVEGSEHNGNNEGSFRIACILENLVTPLAVFLPSEVPVAIAVTGEARGRVRTRKDWSLTFLAIALVFHSLSSGLFQVKYLYAEHIYDWTAEQLSYYISFMGATRASYLVFLFPFILAMFKPVRAVVSLAQTARVKPTPSLSQLFAEMRFDLLVFRCSMLAEFCANAAVVLTPLPSEDLSTARWSQTLFVVATSLASAGAGVVPAIQSFALSTLQGRALAEKEVARIHARVDGTHTYGDHDAETEPGKLLSAAAVLQATGSTILGPMIFGLIYSNTVARFPRAIFAAAAGLILLSIFLTFFIEPAGITPRSKIGNAKMPAHISRRVRRRYEEETRGRSRISKDLRGGAASVSYGATRYNSISVTSSYLSGSEQAGPSSFHR